MRQIVLIRCHDVKCCRMCTSGQAQRHPADLPVDPPTA